MAFLDDEIEGYEPPKVDEGIEDYQPPKAKVRPIKPIKKKTPPVLPVEKRQVFKPQLPPAIGEGPKFKFAQGPFRMTDLQRAELAHPELPGVRASTPEERKQLLDIEKEQEAYQKYGPTLYSLREGVLRGAKAFGTQFTEPFKAPTPNFQRDIQEARERQQARERGEEPLPFTFEVEEAKKNRLEPYAQITRRDESPIVQAIPPVLETAIPIAVQELLTRSLPAGRGVRPQVPFKELGTYPKRLGPGRVVEGAAPPVSPPTPPQLPLQLRQGRTIVGFPPARPPLRAGYLPPGPNDLTRLSPGRLGPLADMGISAYPPRLGGTAEDMTFDLLPGLQPGQAPVMITPGWVMETAAGKPVDGVNILLKDVPSFKNNLIANAPSKLHLSEALFQIEELVKASKEEGLGSISLVNRQANRQQVIPHETFHAGQAELAPSVFEVHDPEWAKNHPIIQELIQNNPDIRAQVATSGNQRATEDILAAELPTYVAAGQGDYYFYTPTGGADFLYDYFDHVADRHGTGALDILSTTAKLPPESKEILESARSTYESRKRERQLSSITAQPRAEIQGRGPEGSSIRGVSGYAEGRALARGDQEGVGNLNREIPQRSTRELALEHGTVSSDIETFDPTHPEMSLSTSIAPIENRFPVGSKVTYTQPGTIGKMGSGEVVGYKKDPVTGDTFLEVKDTYGNTETVSDIDNVRNVSSGPSTGDIVKVKGYSNNAEVTNLLPDGGIEVKFPDGTIDEFDSDQVTKVAPKPTPKVQESNEKRKALVENPIVNVNIGESLPGIEAPVKKEVDIGFPPPTQPPLQGMGSGLPPLRRKIISPEVNEALVRAFTSLMEAGGIKPNPLIPPFLQVRQAVLDGKIAGKELGRLLEENNITADEFADEWAETASVAGTILSELSRIENDQVKIVELMKKDPQLAKTLFPAKQRMEAILRDIETTQLGKNFWQRAGDIAQQLMLSDIRIAVRNAIVTAGRIPIIAVENMTGAWLKAITEGKYKGKTFEQMYEAARSDAITGLEVASEMISAFKPPSLAQMIISGQGENRMKYSEAITQLQKTNPQLHRELVTPGFGPEMLEKGKESVDIARDIMMEMRVDVKRRDEFVKRLDKAERRLQSNVKGLGRVLNAIGYPLDQILRPTNWAEMFFRQPLFYGHLNMRLKLEGQDLAQVIRDGKFDEIPEEILKDSVDEALFATHAYMPRAERGRVESASRGMVMALNKIKLLAPFTQQWFPRALYTSLKFAYEYVPLTPLIGGVPFGAIKPAIRVMRSRSATDPKTGKRVPIEPATFRDYKRLGAALIGTVLYGLAEWIRQSEYAGPQWNQINTGEKGKNGEPLYWELSGYNPLALFLRIADLNIRMRNKLMGDLEWGKELEEAISGMSMSPDTNEWVTAMGKMWGGEENGLWEKTQVGVGRQFSFTTKPFAMLRDGYAAFSDEENKRKDLKGSGIIGPLIDNVPWLRGKYLPNVESMTGPESPKLSEYPATTFGGLRFTEGENFAGREWRRLGLFNRRFLDPDPDPLINRAQNKYFFDMISPIAGAFEKDEHYQEAPDNMKAAMWELFILGDKGIASRAKHMGLMANPEEAARRGIILGSGVGPLQREALGIEKSVEEAIPKK